MENLKKRAKKYLLISIALMLISMIGASIVQSNGGKTQVKDLRWETTLGREMSGLLFVPPNATAENPAPAIVVSHGMYNNREMQDLNFVELSRRGFVVLSMDMFNHGNSESSAPSTAEILPGMYEAVKMLDSLSYVDSSAIGITGHSLGGMSSNAAIALDNEAERQLISAVLLNSADATYVDAETGEYVNIYGNRDAGIVAGQYDEWFFFQDDGKGGQTAPRDFLKYSNAQSFLNFGQDPSGQELREQGLLYQEEIDGKTAYRAIYNPAIIHPWSHFSQRSTVATISFFDAALGAPNPIAAGNQIWQIKAIFNGIGLVGLAMFLLAFVSLMLYTPAFSSLRAKEIAVARPADKKAKIWFWGSLLAGALFATITYLPLLKLLKGHARSLEIWTQSSIGSIGAWALACAVFSLIIMLISYQIYGKKNGLSLKDTGVQIGLKPLGKTVLLSLIAVTVTFAWVFFASYFFKVDFRLWVIAIKAFNAEKVLVAIFPYALMFLAYYVVNSISINAFNFIKIGKKEWINTLIVALFTGAPAIVLLLMQYIHFFITGHLLFASNMYCVWLFQLVVYLPVSAVISRKMYRVSKNPYLGGIICALMITMICCSNTLTWG